MRSRPTAILALHVGQGFDCALTQVSIDIALIEAIEHRGKRQTGWVEAVADTSTRKVALLHTERLSVFYDCRDPRVGSLPHLVHWVKNRRRPQGMQRHKVM